MMGQRSFADVNSLNKLIYDTNLFANNLGSLMTDGEDAGKAARSLMKVSSGISGLPLQNVENTVKAGKGVARGLGL